MCIRDRKTTEQWLRTARRWDMGVWRIVVTKIVLTWLSENPRWATTEKTAFCIRINLKKYRSKLVMLSELQNTLTIFKEVGLYLFLDNF